MSSRSIGFKHVLLALALALVVNNCIWQFAEIKMTRLVPHLIYQITGIAIGGIRTTDENGITTTVYPDQSVQYNPLFIARQAMDDHARIDEPGYRQKFMRATDWLYENAVIRDSVALYSYDFELPRYDLEPGWSSALAQAAILDAVYTRYTISEEPQWLTLSRYIVNSLDPEQSDLGVVLAPEAYWFEEYPSDPHSYVLNGMNSVLLELNRYHQASGDSLAGLLFERGYNGLLLRLPEYDKNGYTWYDGVGNLASRSYHWMHFNQLQELNEIKPHGMLQRYSARWKRNYRIPVCVQLLLNFKPKRALAFAVSWLGFFVLFMLCLILYRRHRRGKTDKT